MSLSRLSLPPYLSLRLFASLSLSLPPSPSLYLPLPLPPPLPLIASLSLSLPPYPSPCTHLYPSISLAPSLLRPQRLVIGYLLHSHDPKKGVLIYEMLVGVAPFHALDPMSTYENILACKVQTPVSFSKVRATRYNTGEPGGGTSGGVFDPVTKGCYVFLSQGISCSPRISEGCIWLRPLLPPPSYLVPPTHFLPPPPLPSPPTRAMI